MGYNVNDVLSRARALLKDAGIDGEMEAVFLLEEVLGKKVQYLASEEISQDDYEKFQSFVTRRISHEPLDSIIGYTEFLGLKIPFSKCILTPRQETEIMVDRVISDFKNKDNLKILDLCSGSGCIGLALAKHLDADVTLADISSEALEVAEDNAQINNIDVKFVQSDLFESINDTYDIIVSNPPYIPSQDICFLESEVRDYDPVLALDGGEDGLDFYRILARNLKDYLKDNGVIYVEFGIYQSEQIVDLFKKDFEDIEVIKDYSGIDRYIKARKKVYVK